MKYKVQCPSCKNEIGMVTILLALSMTSFKCMSCKTRIYVRGIVKLIILNFVVMGLFAIHVLRYQFDSGIFANQEYIYLAIPALIIVFMELIRALLICNKATLKYNKKDEVKGEK
jgi:hypothetical protein